VAIAVIESSICGRIVLRHAQAVGIWQAPLSQRQH
jgi:hypothetical protein